MNFADTAHALERKSSQLSTALSWVAMAFIMVIMALTTVDVVLRYIFNRPISGAFEVTELMMLTVVAFGLAYAQSTKRHIFIELLSRHLSPRGQALNDAFAHLVSMGICVLIVWRLVAQGRVWQDSGVIASHTLQISLYPFYYVLAFGLAVLCLVYITDFLVSLLRTVKKWTR